jgi:hypothetical protein
MQYSSSNEVVTNSLSRRPLASFDSWNKQLPSSFCFRPHTLVCLRPHAVVTNSLSRRPLASFDSWNKQLPSSFCLRPHTLVCLRPHEVVTNSLSRTSYTCMLKASWSSNELSLSQATRELWLMEQAAASIPAHPSSPPLLLQRLVLINIAN